MKVGQVDVEDEKSGRERERERERVSRKKLICRFEGKQVDCWSVKAHFQIVANELKIKQNQKTFSFILMHSSNPDRMMQKLCSQNKSLATLLPEEVKDTLEVDQMKSNLFSRI